MKSSAMTGGAWLTSGALLLSAVAVSAVFSSSVQSFPQGAPEQHTGGFGELDCGQCHYGGDDKGDLSLSEWPDEVEAGGTYELALTLRNSSAKVAGFQLSIRNADGQQYGGFAAGAQQQVLKASNETAEEVLYLTHSESTQAEQGEVVWRVQWQAPKQLSGNTELKLHAAVVAGNHDESPLGDTVVTLAKELKSSN